MTTPSRLPAIGFIGLGAMGRPMASHLAATGHAMQLFDAAPDASVSELARWIERLAYTEITPGAASASAMEKA